MNKLKLRQIMSKLAKDVLTDSKLLNPQYSSGPFVSCNGREFYFDVSSQPTPRWLGHRASPLFGLTLYQEAWSQTRTAEFERLVCELSELRHRCRNRLPENLELLAGSDSHSAIRKIHDYISLSIIDQYPESYLAIVESIKSQFDFIAESYDSIVVDAVVDAENLRFGFDVVDSSERRFIECLNRTGIFYESKRDAGRQILFDLNLAFRNENLNLFWARFALAFDYFSQPTMAIEPVTLPAVSNTSVAMEFFHAFKFAKINGKCPNNFRPLEYLVDQLKSLGNFTVHQVTNENYGEFRSQILDMQDLVYEPTRQTPAEEFDMLFKSDKPLAIVAKVAGQIGAMVFAGRLGLFKDEHGGIGSDPFVNDPTVYYSVDLTVAPEFRGGLGKLMKQTLVMLAIENGVTAIHGRNRDRLAAGMWAINLSLGSYLLQHLENDYQDDELYRDCIYYRCPLRWNNPVVEQQPVENSILSSLVNY